MIKNKNMATKDIHTYFGINIDMPISSIIDIKKPISNALEHRDTFFRPITIRLTDLVSNNDNDEITIAFIEFYVIDELIFDDPQYFLELSDEISGDMLDVVDAFISSDEYNELQECFQYVGYITSIYVSPKYRNQGIGTFLIEQLSNLIYEFIPYDIGCLITEVYSIKMNDQEDLADQYKINRAKKFFKKHKFKKLGKTKYLFRNLNPGH